jgi:hypothetical protein
VADFVVDNFMTLVRRQDHGDRDGDSGSDR